MKKAVIVAGLALLLAAPALHAQTGKARVSAEVVKVDPSLGKITLRHAEIPNLHMEAMTMVFGVREPAMLKGLKAGDKVRFEAEEIDGVKTVTAIQPAK